MGLILLSLSAWARGGYVLGLEDATRTLAATVDAAVVMDDGEHIGFRLIDDGSGVDVTAGDHVFGQTLPTSRQGMKLLLVPATEPVWRVTLPMQFYDTHVVRVKLLPGGEYTVSSAAPEAPGKDSKVDLGEKRAPATSPVDKGENATPTTSSESLPWFIAAASVGVAVALAGRARFAAQRIPTEARAVTLGSHQPIRVDPNDIESLLAGPWRGYLVLALGPAPRGTRATSLLHPLPEELVAEAEELAGRTREPVGILVTDPDRLEEVGPMAPLEALARHAAGRLPLATTASVEWEPYSKGG